jgi:hypothetical protein
VIAASAARVGFRIWDRSKLDRRLLTALQADRKCWIEAHQRELLPDHLTDFDGRWLHIWDPGFDFNNNFSLAYFAEVLVEGDLFKSEWALSSSNIRYYVL